MTKAKAGTKAKAAKKSNSGLDKFRQDYFKKKKGSQKSAAAANAAVVDAWNRLSGPEKEVYNKLAMDEQLLQLGPGQRGHVGPPFNTRCSPKQFNDVVAYVNSSDRLRRKVEEMGFGPLLHFSCKQLPRELCEELIKAFDPPTATLGIRGRQMTLTAADVNSIMGLPFGGKKVVLVGESAEFGRLKAELMGTKLCEVKDLILSGGQAQRFPTLFMLFAMGTLLCPSSSASVSERNIKALCGKKDLAKWDWSSYVLDELVRELQVFKRSVAAGSRKKHVGGCLMLLMVRF